MAGLFPLWKNLRVLEIDLGLLRTDPPSSYTLVAAVERERWENLAILPSFDVDAVDAVVFERLTTDDRVRRLAIEPPPNMSPLLEPTLALKRLREMTSNPKMPARDRWDALGVAGAESLPVLNLNNPNC